MVDEVKAKQRELPEPGDFFGILIALTGEEQDFAGLVKVFAMLSRDRSRTLARNMWVRL